MKTGSWARTVSTAIAAVLAVGWSVGAAAARTIYVDQSNTSGIEDGTASNPYKNLASAIGISSAGDVVQIAPGAYAESITIANGIDIVGSGPDRTHILGAGVSDTITTNYPGLIRIRGVSITGPGVGIKINALNRLEIRNTIIHDCAKQGIYSLGDTVVSVVNSVVYRNGSHGIHLTDGGSTQIMAIVANSIVASNAGYGIITTNTDETIAYSNIWGNSHGEYSGASQGIGSFSLEPLFLGANLYLQANSPGIDAGNPSSSYYDPDGTRNDMGAYGGPGAAEFWPSPAGGPIVTDMSVTPPSVPVGGTITIRATGRIR